MTRQFISRGQVGQALDFAGALGILADHADQPRGAAAIARRAGACDGEADRAQGGGDLDIDIEVGWLERRCLKDGQELTALVGDDPVQEIAGAGMIQVERQDVGGALPADGVGLHVPIENGTSRRLDRKLQAQLIFQRNKPLADFFRLLQCGIQHNPPSPAGFSGP